MVNWHQNWATIIVLSGWVVAISYLAARAAGFAWFRSKLKHFKEVMKVTREDTNGEEEKEV